MLLTKEMSYHGTNVNVRELFPNVPADNGYLSFQQTCPTAPAPYYPVSSCMKRVPNQLLTPIPPNYVADSYSKYFMTAE
jgi:hypothetical protein